MGGWRRYLELQAQAKTGLSSGLFVWALLAVVFGVLTAGFVLLFAFIWLAERYGPLTAAIVLASLFLLATIIAAICCLWSRRRTIERAELVLAARRPAIWLDPKVLGGAIQASRAVGWRKLVPLLAIGMLAAGVGMEWFGRERPAIESEEQTAAAGLLARRKALPLSRQVQNRPLPFLQRSGNRRPPSPLNLRIAEGLRP